MSVFKTDSPPSIAYFSMEIGLQQDIPTYSGGLGMLAGDTLRSAADLGLPLVAVSLVHRKGYFRQRFDGEGRQIELPDTWRPEDKLTALVPRISVQIEGRPVYVRAWLYTVEGVTGHHVPVYLLDTALPENSPYDRTLTDFLYGGDERYRLCQEAILGIGGVVMLRALGHSAIRTYHMNEGHSALLTLALLEQDVQWHGLGVLSEGEVEAVRRHCIFTTHTPVPAGHDKFGWELVDRVLGSERAALLEATQCCHDLTLNMTYLALRFSRYINGVAMLHGEVSSEMFPAYPINAITNGVHAATWTSAPFAELFDREIPGWREDNNYLRYAVGLALDDIRNAHTACKSILIDTVKARTGVALDPQAFTIGFARRATPYKRADLLFSDLDRLRRIAKKAGPIQIVYAGKAHPRDEGGKKLIEKIFDASHDLAGQITTVYIENYDMDLGRILTSGVDLWLNTPVRPQEASGTSGMKAAMNGVPSLSILDGWWVEGHFEGITGWAIGEGAADQSKPAVEIKSLYEKLESVILPLFHKRPAAYAAVMRQTISLNASFFNTQRMMSQYVWNGYFPKGVGQITSWHAPAAAAENPRA